jgi:hypothetical protein
MRNVSNKSYRENRLIFYVQLLPPPPPPPQKIVPFMRKTQ